MSTNAFEYDMAGVHAQMRMAVRLLCQLQDTIGDAAAQRGATEAQREALHKLCDSLDPVVATLQNFKLEK